MSRDPWAAPEPHGGAQRVDQNTFVGGGSLTLTLTRNVEFDGDVEVAPTVDLDFDHRSRFFNEDSETTRSPRTSTYNVDDGVDVHVNVFATTVG
jgi:hypothetical protein